ncbi:MAG TPA: NADH-quinone oxidoreductase subunit M, partial [Methylomirabilota bacterium]|nr:NADH-quinone oxidoreductase subunit M [Methylomirabilota bacterium]
MTDAPLLSITTFLPLLGAAWILLMRGDPEAVARNARWVAWWFSIATFVVSLFVWFGFDRTSPGFQFEEKAQWMPSLNIGYRMGVDGISMVFVLLSTLLTPVCVLASWEAITVRVKEYMIAFLVLETLMVGTFCALD